jgi:hypothetical protein
MGGKAMAMKCLHDPDTMYLWEAKTEKDYLQFLEAMQKEIDDHTKRGHWKLSKRNQVPSGATVHPSVWSMKCKHCIFTRKVSKWKA